jgi:diguanylate cyclase (GGDEF)-like protein
VDDALGRILDLPASGRPADSCVTLAADALDRLMPMYLHLTASGRVAAHGPTLGKIAGGVSLIGQPFFELFEVRRPAGVSDMAALSARLGARLQMILRVGSGAECRALCVSDTGSGLLLNLSFGVSVVDAVRSHALTIADFAATDLTVEMLYLREANLAVMGELQRLNLRLQGAKSAAEEQALTDTLTGLRNRRALDFGLAQAVASARPFALMHLDLDQFKAVNDSFGHAAGDQVLRVVAQVMLAKTRSEDLVARVGGDEFVILLRNLSNLSRLTLVGNRIIAALDRPLDHDGQTLRVGVSIGLTISTRYPDCDPNQMLRDADLALYAAKRAGRGQMVMFRPAGDAHP